MGSHSSKAAYLGINDANEFPDRYSHNEKLSDDLFIPVRIAAVLEQPRLTGPEELEYTWDPVAHSPNVYIHPDDPHVLHRNPVAQSTDCARGRTGVSTGIHAWMVQWKKREYGSHAVLGVATIDCPLQRQGYGNLIGSNAESWGWDLISQLAIHNVSRSQPRPISSQLPWRQEREHQFQNLVRRLASQSREAGAVASSLAVEGVGVLGSDPTTSLSACGAAVASLPAPSPPKVVNSPYPRWTAASATSEGHQMEVGVVCPFSPIEMNGTVHMILDMTEGTLSFVVDGTYLGVAHRGLGGYTLYPAVNCVWGNCEIKLTYLNGMDQEPPSLMQLSRHAVLEQITRSICTNAATSPPSTSPLLTSGSVVKQHSHHHQPLAAAAGGSSPSASTRDSNDNMSPRIVDVRGERNKRIARLPLPKCFKDELLKNWY